MISYIIRRILLMFPTLLGLTALVFFVMAFSPGGIGGQLLDKNGNLASADAERIREYYNKRYGIDQPRIVQYARWLNDLLPIGYRRNDDYSLGTFGCKWPTLGESMDQHRPVSELIAESLPLTLLLNLITIPVIYSIGVMTGIKAARERGKLFDNVSGGVQLALWSVPSIWAGVMLIGLLADRDYLRWFPSSGLHEIQASGMAFLPHWAGGQFERGWLLDAMWHLVLPVVCLSYGSSAFLTKITRGSVLENLAEDYVRTARSKGVAPNVIIYRHVLRNSTLALITVATGILPALLGGSIVIETIFSIPGMGALGVEAVQARDREVVLAVALIGGFINLASQLLRDILYAVADPRVAYG
jgi:peptide/nickel transport system permease protein